LEEGIWDAMEDLDLPFRIKVEFLSPLDPFCGPCVNLRSCMEVWISKVDRR
jgi:hypothetical protein